MVRSMGKYHSREIKRAERARLSAAYLAMQQGQFIDPKMLGMVCCSSCGATKVTLQRMTEKDVKPAVYSCAGCLEGVGSQTRRIKQIASLLQNDPSLIEQEESKNG